MKHIKFNISTIIALAFLFFSFYIFKMVLLREVKAPEGTVMSIIETVKTILILIIGYYFGSSSGSKKKDELLEKQNPPVKEGS